jgi:histone H3/H4
MMTILEIKIKNLLQSNNLIGKIDPLVPKILSNALEFFLSDILNSTVWMIQKFKKKTIQTKYIKFVLKKKIRFSRSFIRYGNDKYN